MLSRHQRIQDSAGERGKYPDRVLKEIPPNDARDSDREAVSRGNSDQFPFPVSGKRQAGFNILGGKVREVLQNFSLRHAGREVIEHVIHGDTQAANAGLATPFAWFDRDVLPVIHAFEIKRRAHESQGTGAALLWCLR